MKPKKDACHRHFVFIEEYNCSRCQHCGTKIKGTHATNMKNHLRVKHKEIFEEVSRLNKEKEYLPRAENKTCGKLEENIRVNCLKLVTIHGRPFQYLEDKAFQDIINISLPSNIREKTINCPNIKSMIADKANEIRSKISMDLQHRLVCLKLDAATYQYRSFVGINVQYINEGKIVIRTLATEEVYESQTGEFLRETLEEVLNSYGIEKSQIYCIIADNGKYSKKMAKLLGGSYNNYVEDEGEGYETDSETDENDETVEEIHIDVERLAADVSESEHSSFTPRTMLCAAHTLQLSIKDAFQSNTDVQDLLNRVRRIVKVLRTPTIRNILTRANLKQPIYDCPTRWSSTYKMLQRFQSYKLIFSDNEEVRALIDESSWQTIDELVYCLKPIHDATNKLQKEQLTLGDFFVEWIACKAHVEQCRSRFGASLLDSMTKRQVGLLQTTLMLEALYLDTRLNIILSDAEVTRAQNVLHETYQQMEKVKISNADESSSIPSPSLTNSDSNQDTPGTSATTIDNTSSTNASIVEHLLNQTELARRRHSHNPTTTEIMIQEIRALPRIPVSENIITHWSNKHSSPEMRDLALCVLAAPATQVSVEILFSSLKYILSPLRSNLSRTILADIMVIRNNKDFFD